MPMYEFRCRRCDARFESLVAAGTETSPCPECGADDASRVLSAPGAPMHLVKSGGAARRQEAQNARLQANAKARFKEARRKARRTKGGGSSPGAA
jgi:putative FmdB family regulatory protein